MGRDFVRITINTVTSTDPKIEVLPDNIEFWCIGERCMKIVTMLGRFSTLGIAAVRGHGRLRYRSHGICSLGSHPTVGYVSDIEGILPYWHKYLDLSHVLERDLNNQIILKDGCQFVYGGDTCDRGAFAV